MLIRASFVSHSAPAVWSLFAIVALATPAWSQQQVTITAPNHNIQDGFFERNGVGFGFNLRGNNVNGPGTRVVGLLPNGQVAPGGDLQFRQGGFNAAQPNFGGFNPGAGANAGVGIGGRGGDAFFNFAAAQGRTTSHTMEAPMVTVMNGMPGSFSDQIQSPFVTGVTPVVGGIGGGYTTSPLAAAGIHPSTRISPLRDRIQRMQAGEHGGGSHSAPAQKRARAEAADAPPTPREQLDAADSTADQPALSVAEIQRRRAAGQQAADLEARQLMERGRLAAEAGKPGVAKIFYRQAVSATTGPLREEAQQRLRELTSSAAASSAER